MKSYLKCSENRLIAWVFGGVTQTIASYLRGALPEAKGKGVGVQRAYNKANKLKIWQI